MEVIAVDLRPLRPSGANGGIKPAIFSLIREAGRQRQDSLLFVFLTNSASHAEVRALARPQDILICVLEEPAFPLGELHKDGPLEFKLLSPPENLPAEIGVDLLYCPFGDTSFHSKGIPAVALIADLLHLDYPFALTSNDVAERDRYIQLTIRNASKIQCISLSGIARLVHHFGLSRQSLFHTYLPVHERLAASVSNSENKPAGRKSIRPYFFYPANMWKHKNHESLFLGYNLYLNMAGADAWDLLLTHHEDERARELRKLAVTIGIDNHAVFKGHVTENELHRLWQEAGALVFPSLHEGFGIPPVEAMHYGVPIITSGEFSLKEIVGEAGFLIDPRNPRSIANGLYKISTDAAFRETLIDRGKCRLKFFNLEVETKKLLEVFTSLIIDRKSNMPSQPGPDLNGALFLPTPASSAVHRIRVKADPGYIQNRYSLYLDNIPYGAFCTAMHKDGIFSFECVPEGKILAVLAGTDRGAGKQTSAAVSPLEAVEEVTALSNGRDCLLLHKRETATSYEG